MDPNQSCSPMIVHSNSCALSPAEIGEKDAIAAVRMMVSLLSVMGASAIIASIICNKQTWSPTLHPILQLSVADWILGVLWVVGACVWFRGASDTTWCFGVSLLTVILECVTANLTLVYSIQAYSTLKKKRTRSALEAIHSPSTQIWHPCKSALVYLVAWCLPLLVVVIVFGILAGTTRLVKDARACSCWCFPLLGNVLPYSLGRDTASALYVWHVRKLMVAYSTLIFLNFLVVFVIMAIFYYKILREIKEIRGRVAKLDDDVINISVRGNQARARTRIMHFLTVYLIIALSMVVLCILVLYYEGHALSKGAVANTYHGIYSLPPSQHHFYGFVHLFQSVTVPLQGFLNAIVYGRTREDFVDMMSSTGRIVVRSEQDTNEIRITQYDSESEPEDEDLFGSKSLTPITGSIENS